MAVGFKRSCVRVRVFVDRMELSGNGRQANMSTHEPFTTQRLLIGSVQPAVNCLQRGLRAVQVVGVMKMKPIIKIVAEDKSDGGLSEVEERVLLEVGHAAGAHRVEIENPRCT